MILCLLSFPLTDVKGDWSLVGPGSRRRGEVDAFLLVSSKIGMMDLVMLNVLATHRNK